MNRTSTPKFALSLLVAGILSGCMAEDSATSDGGGTICLVGQSCAIFSSIKPTMTVTEDKTVNEGDVVVLTAEASHTSETIESVVWTQTSGTSVTLLSATATSSKSNSVSFVAPDVNTTTVLTFSVTATSSNQQTVTDSVSITIFAPGLNDTGITSCSNASSSGGVCPANGYPGQDGEFGRDIDNNDNKDGRAGFSFTKVAYKGTNLVVEARDWRCVSDNVTGLLWEVKTDDGSIHDKDRTFTWYDNNSQSNGGNAGTESTCVDNVCSTKQFIDQLNTMNDGDGFCGYTDWRLPTREELRSIVDYNITESNAPTIDTTYFPNASSAEYWTGLTKSDNQGSAIAISFANGQTMPITKGTPNRARAVRSGN